MSADDWPAADELAEPDRGPEAILDGASFERLESARVLLDSSYAGAAVRRTAIAISAAAGFARLSGPIRYFIVFAGDGAADAAEAVSAIATDRLNGPAVITQHLDHATSWLGINDCLLILSNSGTDEASLAAAQLAQQRGTMLVVCTAKDSALATSCTVDRNAIVLELEDSSALPFWEYLAVGHGLVAQLQGVEGHSLAALAEALDAITAQNGPVVPAMHNLAKGLALDCLDSTPLAISDSLLSAAAAYRYGAAMLALQGIPVAHVQLPGGIARMRAALKGPYVRAAEDIFFDPFEDGASAGPSRPLRLVMLCESADETYRTILTREAADRGVGLTLINATGADPTSRLASLVQITDLATAYLLILSEARGSTA
ncbi:MAG: SIS domain-containing protein [Antricoccus sp.]